MTLPGPRPVRRATGRAAGEAAWERQGRRIALPRAMPGLVLTEALVQVTAGRAATFPAGQAPHRIVRQGRRADSSTGRNTLPPPAASSRSLRAAAFARVESTRRRACPGEFVTR